MTEYVILQKDINGGWTERATITASSDLRALRIHGDAEGHFVAVPKRSWRPRHIEVEHTTKLTIT